MLDDLKNYTIIVLSQQAISFPETNVKVCSSPTEALRLIENLGYSQALLVGGSLINTAFAKAHLLEDIYMTYNPVIIGEGISPFSETVKLDLQLEEIKQLAYDIVQLHYRVKEE
ncbi:MAG: dihydrofolate reductase family protein [Candidatus Peribacteria bacterium]|nr:dihydrofolate reductase family protein [Candidatus Peribacteria bacterium]